MHPRRAAHRRKGSIASHVRAFAGWLRLEARPLRGPPLRRLRPVRRWWAAAAWGARAAVVAGLPLGEHLRACLAGYERRLPVPRSALRVRIRLDDGELSVTWAEEDPELGSPGAATGAGRTWMEALASVDGPAALREVASLWREVAGLAAEGTALRAQAGAAAERFVADVEAGALPPRPGPAEAAEHLGRPPVRGPGREVLLWSAGISAILAQAWVMAVPLLVAAGRYPPVRAGERGAGLLETSLTCVFALGVSAGLAALMRGALAVAAAVERAGALDRRRTRPLAFLACIAAAAAVAAASSLPAPRSGLPPATHALLLLAVSGGAALAMRSAGLEREARGAETTLALAWDRDRTRSLGERARRLAAWVRTEEAVRDVEVRRERAQRRLAQLAHRGARAVELLARHERTRRVDRNRLSASLVAALERDRLEFVRQATARGALELLPARWRPAEAPPLPREAGSGEAGRLAG